MLKLKIVENIERTKSLHFLYPASWRKAQSEQNKYVTVEVRRVNKYTPSTKYPPDTHPNAKGMKSVLHGCKSGEIKKVFQG